MVAILKFYKWYLLPNRKLDWAENWWEALEQHRDSELLKSFCYNIQDGHHGSHILKIIKPHLLMNSKWDWDESWWGGHWGHMENHSVPISKIVAMAATLKFFKQDLPNCKWDWDATWWEALECYWDSELLKLFYSNEGNMQIQNCEKQSDLITKMITMAQCIISWSA